MSAAQLEDIVKRLTIQETGKYSSSSLAPQNEKSTFINLEAGPMRIFGDSELSY